MTIRSLIHTSLLCLALITHSLLAMGADLTLSSNAPKSYIVEEGDTLWDISAIFLEDPWLWPDLWRANPAINNPNLIYPGDQIHLHIHQDGFYLSHQVSSASADTDPIETQQSLIPVAAIKEFFTKPLLISTEQFMQAATIIGSHENRLMFAQGDSLYVTNSQNMKMGEMYSIYRQGSALHDPVTHKLLGHQTIEIGQALVTHPGVPATIKLTKTTREVVAGDRLTIMHDSSPTDLRVHRADMPVTGQIISLFNALSQAGNYQIIIANAGHNQGLRPGHIVSLARRGATKHDHQLTNENIADAVIFRAFEEISYLLILNAERPVKVGDLVSSS